MWITRILCLLVYLQVTSCGAVCACDKVYRQPGNLSALSGVPTTTIVRNDSTCQVVIEAPQDSVILLNITQIYGFHMGATFTQSPHATSPCSPKLEIEQVASSGQADKMLSVCGGGGDDKDITNTSLPKVFQSQESKVKIRYVLPANRYSGFTVMFQFHRRTTNCPSSPTAQTIHATRDLIQAVVIVLALAFTVSVVVCVLCHYRTSGWLCRNRRASEAGSLERSHLHPSSSTPGQSTEVVYVPGSTSDRFVREMAVQRDRQVRLQAVRHDLDLNLPPSIPLSQDGEEGYVHSQRLLHKSCDLSSEIDRESVRPPPNRTIFEGESPPPYRSNSVGRLEKPKGSEYPGLSPRDCGNSQYLVQSCYVSNNNKVRNSNWNGPLYSGIHSGIHSQQTVTMHPPTMCHPTLSQSRAARTADQLVSPPVVHSRSSSSSSHSSASTGPTTEGCMHLLPNCDPSKSRHSQSES